MPFFRLTMLFSTALMILSQTNALAEEDALIEYRKGNYEKAVEICKNEIKSTPNNVDSYVVLCWSLLHLGRYYEAVPYADKAYSLSKYDVRVIEIMGEVNYYQGKNRNALNYFQEYVNLAPEGQRIETVYFFMGEIYIRMGYFHYADIAISTALHYLPKNALWWVRAGYAREMSGEIMEAIVAYKNALALNSSLSDAKIGINRATSALRR